MYIYIYIYILIAFPQTLILAKFLETFVFLRINVRLINDIKKLIVMFCLVLMAFSSVMRSPSESYVSHVTRDDLMFNHSALRIFIETLCTI